MWSFIEPVIHGFFPAVSPCRLDGRKDSNIEELVGVCHGCWYCGNTDVVGGGMLQNIMSEVWLIMCVWYYDGVYVLDHQGGSRPAIGRVKVSEIILPSDA